MENEKYDDFDKLLYNEFYYNLKITPSVEKCIDDTLYIIKNRQKSKYKIKDLLKKVAMICISAITLFGGYCFAKAIIQYYFYPENNGIETAASNGYIYTVNSDYVISNNNKLKVDNILMDDYTLNLSFSLELDNVDYTKIEDLIFSNILITDDYNNILYANNEQSFNNYCDKNNLNYSFMDFTDNYINSGVNWYIQSIDNNIIKVIYNFTPSGLSKYPNSKSLNINLKDFKIAENSEEISSNWFFTIDLPDYFYNRTNISYKLAESNNPNFKIKEFNVYKSCSKLLMKMPKPEKVVSDEEFTNLTKQFLEENNEKNKKIQEDPNEDIPQSETEKRLLEIVDAQGEIYRNIYIENSVGKRFYPSNTSFENSGSYDLTDETIFYWNTFNLTSNDLTDFLTLHISYNNNDIIIKLQRN